MVTIMSYKTSTIDHAIDINILSYVNVSYITVFTDYVLNTTTNETEFTELRRVFKEYFELRFQEGYILKYPNFGVCHYPLCFGVGQTDHIIEIVMKQFPTVKVRKVDTPFSKDSTYKKYLMDVLPLTVNFLRKAEMEYHGEIGHTIAQIQDIATMSGIEIC